MKNRKMPHVHTDAFAMPIRVKKYQVNVVIVDDIATTKIELVLKNRGDAEIEGACIFPPGFNTDISDFVLCVDGIALPAEKKTTGYDAPYICFREPTTSREADVGGIPTPSFLVAPNGERRVQIEYTQQVQLCADVLMRYTYPLSIPVKTRSIDSFAEVESLVFSLSIESADELPKFRCASHDATIRRKGKHRAIVKYKAKNVRTYRDFVLSGSDETDIPESFVTLLSADTSLAIRCSSPLEPQSNLSGMRLLSATTHYETLSYSPSPQDALRQIQSLPNGLNPPNDAAYNDIYFKHHGPNPFIDTEDDTLSTFGLDVDTASYSMMRRYLCDGYLPEPDAVRVEEFINTFDYDYSPPTEGAFAMHLEGAPSKFGEGKRLQLLRIGIKGRVVPETDRKDARLTFVIDISGSMGIENRLGLVKRALTLLVNELREGDEVGIVTYGWDAQVVLPHTRVQNREHILNAIQSLVPAGATYAEKGILLGYELAAKNLDADCINRVILCSDGVANVGDTGPDTILDKVSTYVDKGIWLTTVGFGMGNYNDVLMEQLANKGNGMYAYVDTLAEAKRIFVENLTGTLQVIAKDAKMQVEFNPQTVSRFRLLGYEKRRLEHEDFRNDDVDAGDVGSGHNVTALYELKLHKNANGHLAQVSVRYKDPGTEEAIESAESISTAALKERFEAATPAFQLAAAVAQYAEILRKSFWAKNGDLKEVRKVLKGINLQTPQHEELLELVRQAIRLKKQ